MIKVFRQSLEQRQKKNNSKTKTIDTSDGGLLLIKEFEFMEYDNVQPDAPDNIVEEVAVIGRRENVDCLVGVGGGSTMDFRNLDYQIPYQKHLKQ